MNPTTIAGNTVPRFAPHARFRFDSVRQAWVVLMPERLLLPDEQAVAVLRLVDGSRDAAEIVDLLGRQYDAPRAEIMADVLSLLQDLVDRKVLRG